MKGQKAGKRTWEFIPSRNYWVLTEPTFKPPSYMILANSYVGLPPWFYDGVKNEIKEAHEV